MKQTLNKLLIGLFFVFGIMLIPTSVVNAETFEVRYYADQQYVAYVSLSVDVYATSAPYYAIGYASVDGSTGGNVYLRYNVPGVAIDPSNYLIYAIPDNRDPSGQTVPLYLATGNYVMNFYGDGGDAMGDFNVGIPFSIKAVPTVEVFANPSSIVKGTSNDISVAWTATGADNCIEDGGRGGNGTTGSFMDYGVSDVATYSVYCYDINGSVVAYGDASVTASPPPLVPSVTVFVDDQENPAPVKKGAEVEVRWVAKNVVSCAEDGGRGGNDLFGSFRTVINEKTTFNVCCTDEEGGNVTCNPPSANPPSTNPPSTNPPSTNPPPIGLGYDYIIKNNTLGLGYLYDIQNNPVSSTNRLVYIVGNTEELSISTDRYGKVITIIGSVGHATYYAYNNTVGASFDGTKFFSAYGH